MVSDCGTDGPGSQVEMQSPTRRPVATAAGTAEAREIAGTLPARSLRGVEVQDGATGPSPVLPQ